jgi:hypothetical protein
MRRSKASMRSPTWPGRHQSTSYGTELITPSPFHFNAEEPSELFIPAINGTVGVLKSIKKNK